MRRLKRCRGGTRHGRITSLSRLSLQLFNPTMRPLVVAPFRCNDAKIVRQDWHFGVMPKSLWFVDRVSTVGINKPQLNSYTLVPLTYAGSMDRETSNHPYLPAKYFQAREIWEVALHLFSRSIVRPMLLGLNLSHATCRVGSSLLPERVPGLTRRSPERGQNPGRFFRLQESSSP